MSDFKRQLCDGEFGSGSVSTVVRHGEAVQRPSGPWTPAVHALLHHLTVKGYSYSPRVLGSGPGTETLTYIHGEVALRPWPVCFLEDAAIEAVGTAICQYHQAVSDFVPSHDSVWRCPDNRWAPGMIIRHGDLGPWNMVWRDGQLAGIIDWDLAEPGTVLEDMAQLAWHCLPLTSPEFSNRCGILPGPVRSRRLSLLCEICRVHPNELLEAVHLMQTAEAERIQRLGQNGIEPWTAFHARGDVTAIEHDQSWLNENRKSLEGTKLENESGLERSH